MNHLEWNRILDVHQKSIECGLHERRRLLLGGLPPLFVSSLPIETQPSSQLLSDLSTMNEIDEITGGVIPLERWMRNATYLFGDRPKLQTFYREVADEIALAAGGGARASDSAHVAERIIFTNDLVSYSYLSRAHQTGQSVVQLKVPRIESGLARQFPYSNDPMYYLGTGWLIGSQHVITNHHVVNARSDGEDDSSADDLARQAGQTVIRFDYDSPNAVGHEVRGGKLVGFDKGLDYAIVELAESTSRMPLSLWPGVVSIEKEDRLPVNIIQHPGGNFKQIGLRNNLAAWIKGNDVAYFTDTEAGSSGAPVCTDEWTVIAIHKATKQAPGGVEFQGKTSSWINVGTRIDLIVGDIRERFPELWERMGVVFSGV